MMFDLCAMFVMLFALSVACREHMRLDRELSIHRRTVRVKHNPPNTYWYPAGCKCIHRASAYSGTYTVWYAALCFCIRWRLLFNTPAPPAFCSRPQLNINIRGSNMRHRVVRVIDTVIGVVFWSSVTVVVLYSAFSKHMCSKRNQMWVFVNNTPCPPPTTRDVSPRNHYAFRAIAKHLHATRLKFWELSPQTPAVPIYTTCRSTSCMWKSNAQLATERVSLMLVATIPPTIQPNGKIARTATTMAPV